MNKELVITVRMEKSYEKVDYSTLIKMTGNPAEVTTMAMEAMYMLNKQFNDMLPDSPKNSFWNCMVEQMGERLLEESKK